MGAGFWFTGIFPCWGVDVLFCVSWGVDGLHIACGFCICHPNRVRNPCDGWGGLKVSEPDFVPDDSEVEKMYSGLLAYDNELRYEETKEVQKENIEVLNLIGLVFLVMSGSVALVCALVGNWQWAAFSLFFFGYMVGYFVTRSYYRKSN
jgi:hypothetical protein